MILADDVVAYQGIAHTVHCRVSQILGLPRVLLQFARWSAGGVICFPCEHVCATMSFYVVPVIMKYANVLMSWHVVIWLTQCGDAMRC